MRGVTDSRYSEWSFGHKACNRLTTVTLTNAAVAMAPRWPHYEFQSLTVDYLRCSTIAHVRQVCALISLVEQIEIKSNYGNSAFLSTLLTEIHFVARAWLSQGTEL